jgi:hypothetical protein
MVLFNMIKKFTAKKLALKLNKMNIIKHIKSNSPQHMFSFCHNEEYIEESLKVFHWFANW